MKILSAAQMREADNFTIINEPVSSYDLMERAAKACFDLIIKNADSKSRFTIICSTGNNGGDGLVIARMLATKKLYSDVVILNTVSPHSDNFQKNLEAVRSAGIPVKELSENDSLVIQDKLIIIDAIFGTGLTRPVTGWLAKCIDTMNESGNKIISIDLPSGLFADRHTDGTAVCSSETLTFQCPKLAFLFPENEKYTGELHVLDIGLHKKFIESINATKYYIDRHDVINLLKPRKKFSHKGTYGKSLLISGSKGKMGAAVLAAKACLRSGSGLLTVHAPQCGYDILQTAIPEAMVETDQNNEIISSVKNAESYDAIGIGPGIGTRDETCKMFLNLIDNFRKPMVVDADALNILSGNPEKIKSLPSNSILTPHIKEFERIAGKSKNDFDRHELQLEFSKENNVIVVLKGSHTCITTPQGIAYFNSTGNPGMAKGGSGDALTGMILGFLSQHYDPVHAAILAVYLHGLAGDIAAEKKGVYSMMASDLIEAIPEAFLRLKIED